MDIDHILISGCPLCEIFLGNNNIITKLYYKDGETIENSDFIIMKCKTCKNPIVVIRDHVSSISKELWGRILYTVRNEFGFSSKLKLRRKPIEEHWYASIIT